VLVVLRGSEGREMRLLFTDDRRDAAARSEECALRLQGSTLEGSVAWEATRTLWSRLERAGMRSVAPPGMDAFVPLEPSVASRLARLRDAAPFGELAWTETIAKDAPSGVEILLRAPDGSTATVWLSAGTGRATGGYRVDGTSPPPPVIDGLRQVIAALRG
jgi:hypothetical protein